MNTRAKLGINDSRPRRRLRLQGVKGKRLTYETTQKAGFGVDPPEPIGIAVR